MHNQSNIIFSGLSFEVNFEIYIHHNFQTGQDNFTHKQYFEYKFNGNFMEYLFLFFCVHLMILVQTVR